MELEVGAGFVLARANEPAGLADVGGELPALEHEPVEDVPQPASVVERAHVVGRLVDGEGEQVVLKVPTDARRLDRHVDVMVREVVRVSDAREHEQLRGVDRAGAEDHLLARAGAAGPAVLSVVDAGRMAVLDGHRRHLRAGLGGEVRAVEGGLQVRVGRAVAFSVLLRDVVQADALLCRPVEVVVPVVARRGGGADERLGGGPRRGLFGDAERSVRSVVRRSSRAEALRPLEVLQHRVVLPPVVAQFGPVVVVGRVAADVDHRVVRRAAAEGLAARPVQLPAAAVLLRLGVVLPVRRGLEQLRERRRNPDVPLVVRLARFEQQHGRLRVLCEPVREDAARGPGTDDDVVVLAFHHGRSCAGRPIKCTRVTHRPSARAPVPSRSRRFDGADRDPPPSLVHLYTSRRVVRACPASPSASTRTSTPRAATTGTSRSSSS
ncbi:hypothetical protein BN903_7 [Halorubrum sp. AJ67]|nr:hypothetical protein BN903_7 [Halorubrum sp. AJ67]